MYRIITVRISGILCEAVVVPCVIISKYLISIKFCIKNHRAGYVFAQPTRWFYLIKFSVMLCPSFHKTMPAKVDRTQHLFAALAHSKEESVHSYTMHIPLTTDTSILKYIACIFPFSMLNNLSVHKHLF